jgi:hypothetical protein
MGIAADTFISVWRGTAWKLKLWGRGLRQLLSTSKGPVSITESLTLQVVKAAVSDYLGRTAANRQFIVDINAVGGTVGVRPSNNSGVLSGKQVFTGEAGGTTYSNEQLIDGQNTLRFSANQGSTGFGSLGGAINYTSHASVPAALVKGDEFWVKTKIRFPSVGWVWNPNGKNKFFRNLVFTSAGVSNGYIDLYLEPQNAQGIQLWWIYEGQQQWINTNAASIFFDTDHIFEMHVVLDDVSGADGGQALQRVWLDGNLMINGTQKTINSATDYMSLSALFYYYDDAGAPANIHCYAKEYIVRSSVPAQRDSNGYPFIGV